MNYGDTLVGSIAILFSIISAFISLGPWTRPYQLRTISLVNERFGRTTARLVWMIVAIAAFVAGIAILADIRPAYT
ncbi:hypothetical protein Q31b_21030 [Novipirellula aureliae]|uniref:Uncharacterized protein n=1 Tax=Novipirellula aureliae TaxID=2527966 RepID=A0A5C6E6I0_9BACT|nr:hypothetical protein [Novipirellula aureliae]TWU43066.1 hypothetical protein Q31b_21030 [Novipirellula aureliae]